MNKTLQLTLLIAILLSALSLSAQVRSCYDIQYTSFPSGDSPFKDQVVTVQALVSGSRYYTGSSSSSFGFYLTDSVSGPFTGLFVYSNQYQPQVGDLIRITGTIVEYYNLTEMSNITNYQIISSGNALPDPALVSTGSLMSAVTAEQWEGCLVKVQDVTVNAAPNNYQEFYITDGSGSCQVDNGFFNLDHTWQNVLVGTTFLSIVGIVDYNYSIFGLNPRSNSDLTSDDSTISLSIPAQQQSLSSNFAIPVYINGISAQNTFSDFQMNISYNPNILQYISTSSAGTLTAGGGLSATSQPGTLSMVFNNAAPITNSGVLFNLNFMGFHTGTSQITATDVIFDGNTLTNVINGTVIINSSYNSLGDTLTVIQRPILNVPEIVIPGETMSITCVAPQTTSGWQANLLHGNKTIALTVNSTEYVTSPDRWLLSVTIPNVPVYELYNLQVLASGGISDITRNAVQVLPSRRTNYYFAHLTDLHMPTRIFYPGAGWDVDSTSVLDFRAVMEDLNIIRPEFVLITGDIFNEGEMENFNGLYWFGWLQKIFSEFEIPFYLVAGNHDIGGWNSTPPPAGSSRRNWWRYFGWKWLDNSSTTWPLHTQDYSFNYGNTQFIGLEAYDNYENWRTNIYGSQSFTYPQLTWLNMELNSSPLENKVLFYHYDFSDQISLSASNVDMALWGHIHSNSGSITSQPFNLSTRSVCDGNRAYRIIRVNGSTLVPYNTIYAGASGSSISVNYFPNNYGLADSVRATLYNGQSIGFENSLIEFKMPSGGYSYNVTGGVLEQVDRSGAFNICYVRVNLGANSTVNVSISTGTSPVDDEVQIPAVFSLQNTYPNPFRSNTSFTLHSTKAVPLQIRVYNLKGEVVKELFKGYSDGSEQMFGWDGKNRNGADVPTGMYLIRVQSANLTQTLKTIKVK
ncbi:MAG: hypothetical protein CVU48_11075 [Candidatus Cloacimonetes bacterium HGW-Cloacimonetes-1]|jgi:hypothetical protein|nr:MAG: hypothetical protein CVU48_11075 [Candidatus Cloacimonetes bacterium HGW-Cloacimonetes-1]